MVAGTGTLREQMMRCYLLGYISTRHNELKNLLDSSGFSTYREFKKFNAIEKLKEYGVRPQYAQFIVKVTPPFERTISIAICIWLFVIYTFRYIKERKSYVSFTELRFCPKLNIQESRLINMYKSAGLGIGDYYAIDIPGQYTKYEKVPTVSVFSGINFEQLCKSFICSVRISWYMITKYHKDDLLFRSYSSFPFFLCFFFIHNLDESNELVFFNHYDRWMYLFGNSNLQKTYVQHGKLSIDQIPRIYCDVAYYINSSQKTILEHTLFINKPEARFRKIFDYSGMEKIKNNGIINLLIICTTLFSEKHESILKYLNGKRINIYLKPHPQDNMDVYNQLKKEYTDIVILERFDYPKVDYVISYNSTLADEYEMHNIPVLLYENVDFNEKLHELMDKL